MNEIDFLNWVRGPGFQIAVIIFIAGIIIRLVEILLLGRKPNLAEAKGSAIRSGLYTIASRSIPDKGTFKRSTFVIVTGYIFHIGLLITIFFFTPHTFIQCHTVRRRKITTHNHFSYTHLRSTTVKHTLHTPGLFWDGKEKG